MLCSLLEKCSPGSSRGSGPSLLKKTKEASEEAVSE